MPTRKTKKMEKKTYTYEEYVKNLRPKSLGRLKGANYEPQTRPVILPHGGITKSSEPTKRP